MKNSIVTLALVAASSSVYAAGIGHPAENATIHTSIPGVCAVVVDTRTDTMNEGRNASAEIEFTVLNNISAVTGVTFGGTSDLVYVDGSSAEGDIWVQWENAKGRLVSSRLDRLEENPQDSNNYKTDGKVTIIPMTVELNRESEKTLAAGDYETTVIANVECN